MRTYPVIRAKLRARQIHIHAWVYKIETGESICLQRPRR
nr:hypothetical protein [Microcoleus sp. FACHB-68]